MGEKRRFIEQATGEEYIHKAVWLVVKRQIDHGANRPKGAQLDHLVALVFASHALEGYANCLGMKVAPDQGRDERNSKTLHETAMARFPRAELLPGALHGILSMQSTTAALKG